MVREGELILELKKIILIDKFVEETEEQKRTSGGMDLNLKVLVDRWHTVRRDQQLYTCGRAYSYREVMSNILHEPFAPSLVIDRFCLAEDEVEIELTLRAACKSVARVVSLPWMTVERWHTPKRKWNFIQEFGELITDTLLVSRIEEALWTPAKLLSKSEVLAGSISGLELFMLLQSLASSFPQGFCYVHTLRGEQRICLYFDKNNLVHCIFYDQVTYTLFEGREALTNLVNAVIVSSQPDVAGTKSDKFCFRFFNEPFPAKQIPSTIQIKPEEAFIKAVVSLENEKNNQERFLKQQSKSNVVKIF